MDLKDSILTGAIDMHQHLGPSVIPRRMNVLEGAQDARAAGMRGILVKDHQFPTVATVEMVRSILKDDSFFVGSSIVLNHELGGFNPAAVETAINMGVNMVWMPTISCENHHLAHQRSGLVFPASKKRIPQQPRGYVQILDESGRVTQACREVLRTVALDKNVILGGGHGSAKEISAIIKEAQHQGIEKIVVNHPTYMIDASLEEMKSWTRDGVYLEFGVGTCDPESSCCNMKIQDVAELIGLLGTSHLTLGSDYGQAANPTPVEGLKHFTGLLLDQGISESMLAEMMKTNPAKLLNLEIHD